MTLYASYLIIEEILINENKEIKININDYFNFEEIKIFHKEIIEKIKIFLKMKYFNDKLKPFSNFEITFNHQNGDFFIIKS
jgi:hypothetical protein